ncbi:MAG: hypothetical protein C4530_09905 [Desulfobacteraceae bacterium]|nr:MAG: hypothetical protein C4530_09905 [Desulfobacteraceae bacterium]
MKEIDHTPDGCTYLPQINAEPCEVPERLERNQKQGSKGLWQRILSWIYNYTVDDLNRLKEAGIQIVEADASQKRAEALRKLEEAQKIHAETERIRIENEIKRQSASLKLEDNRITEEKANQNEDSNFTINNFKEKNKSLAQIRVLKAIKEIENNGGQVIFDKRQFENLKQIED